MGQLGNVCVYAIYKDWETRRVPLVLMNVFRFHCACTKPNTDLKKLVHLKKYIIICVCARVFVLFLKSFKRPELESSFKKRILDLSSLVFINRPSKYYPWQIFFLACLPAGGSAASRTAPCPGARRRERRWAAVPAGPLLSSHRLP